jgi:hypothetical protein
MQAVLPLVLNLHFKDRSATNARQIASIRSHARFHDGNVIYMLAMAAPTSRSCSRWKLQSSLFFSTLFFFFFKVFFVRLEIKKMAMEGEQRYASLQAELASVQSKVN